MYIQHTVILTSLCKWKRPKWLFLLLNGTHYARQKMAVRSTQCQNSAVRGTQGGMGYHPNQYQDKSQHNLISRPGDFNFI